MQKAFIFDLDGVLINNEHVWESEKKKIFTEILGEEKFSRLGSTIGLDINTIYHKLATLGATISIEELHDMASEKALMIYQDTPITQGIKELGAELLKHTYALGIVSASPKNWMDLVINRLEFKKDISVIISLLERKDLAHKPSPAGYLEAIRVLHSTPETTIILEDSNTGIASAKAAGAYTIGLKQNLVKGYIQKGADIYADTLDEVKSIVLLHKT
jgi:beta-phosphoglucomutase-like phosphatase (HAD superfamily)